MMSHESHVFNKKCYTSRSTGYKYRTLATNTGDKTFRDSEEDLVYDRKFKELEHTISDRINQYIDKAQSTRDEIRQKFEKINSKIDSAIEIYNEVKLLKKDLIKVENSLFDIGERIDRLDTAVGNNDSENTSKSGYSLLHGKLLQSMPMVMANYYKSSFDYY